MKHSNPLEPQGSLFERAAQSRSRLKVAVFTSIGISVIGLTIMLVAGPGCKREEPAQPPPPPVDTMPPPPFEQPTNPPTTGGSNVTSAGSNTYVAPPVEPVVPPTPPTPPTPPPAAGQEHVIKQGDTFASLSKKYGVSVKAIQAANPGVDPRKLKINQKIIIPAATAPTASGAGASPAPTAVPTSGATTHVIESGDTFASLAKKYGVSVKAIQKANPGVDPRKLKVKQVVNLPAGTSAAPSVPAAVPPPAPVPAAPTPPPATPTTPPASGAPPA